MPDEIIVVGPRIPRFGMPRREIAPAPSEGVRVEPPIGPAALGFVSPGVPAAIEEIIVTGKRTAQTIRAAPRPGRLTPGLLIASVGGFLTSKILEELSQQHLERAFAEFESIKARVKPDTPLQVEPAPAPTITIPEIIVTARRRSGLIDLLTGGVPLPRRITPPGRPPRPSRRRPAREPRPPGRPPRPRRRARPGEPAPIRPPIPRPQTIPRPPPATQPTAPPATIPRQPPATIPRQPPATINLPGQRLSFAPAPSVFPGALPGAVPGAGFGISPALGIAPNPALTGIGVTTVPSIGIVGVPAVQPAAQQARCKPCPRKKDKDEKRKKCFVKLVTERRFKRWDRVNKWREIDCDTGRPL